MSMSRQDNGLTPLLAACAGGHLAVVDALLAGGAPVNQASSKGATPLVNTEKINNAAYQDCLKMGLLTIQTLKDTFL